MSEDKEYAGTMMLGVTTDTQDRAGVTLEERPVPPLDDATVRAAFEKYSGDFYQMPPMVSAIKQGGVPLYKLARQGKTVEREPRLVHVYRYTIDRIASPEIDFSVVCSKGLLRSHLRARHRRDARLRRASQEFAPDKIGTVQRRRRDHGGGIEDVGTGGHSRANPDAAGSVADARRLRMTNERMPNASESTSRHDSSLSSSSLDLGTEPASRAALSRHRRFRRRASRPSGGHFHLGPPRQGGGRHAGRRHVRSASGQGAAPERRPAFADRDAAQDRAHPRSRRRASSRPSFRSRNSPRPRRRNSCGNW